MIKRLNKRGLSTIVATLLIILLTLVAVGIIWVVVRNVIQSGAEQVSLGKFTLNLEIKSVTVNLGSNSVNVRIKRNSGEGEISGIDFIVEDDKNTDVIKTNLSLNELDERTINLSLKSVNMSNIQKVSVAPVFLLESGKEVIGDIKDEYDVPSSSIIGGIACVPQCVGKQCGDNGCGGTCGDCPPGSPCTLGICT